MIEPLHRDKKLFCFGYGYTAGYLAEHLQKFGWDIAGTTTDPDKRTLMDLAGIKSFLFDFERPLVDPYSAFEGVTHILLSIPPGAEGDIVALLHGMDIAAIPTLEWVGYLSTTGIYGNHEGSWVDETIPPEPTSRRGSVRLRAEQQWQYLHLHEGLPAHLFRLAGIYGPGRSALDSVRAGSARRIEKKDHVFNRIHVEDIVQALVGSMNKPNPGAIYNLADDLPSPSHEVITFACNLLGMSAPPVLSFDQAELAPMVRSFYKDNKRVRADRMKNELGVELLYSDYRAGLQGCFDLEVKAMDFLNFNTDDDMTAR